MPYFIEAEILGGGTDPWRADEIDEMVAYLAGHMTVHAHDAQATGGVFVSPWPFPFRMRSLPRRRQVEEYIGDTPRPYPGVVCQDEDLARAAIDDANTAHGWSLGYDGSHTPEWNMRTLVAYANTVLSGD